MTITLATEYRLPLATAFRAELVKSRHSTTWILAICIPLILGVPTLAFSFMGAVNFAPTFLWNYWYSMLMPVTICLIAASCAMWDKKLKLHSITSLPYGQTRIFIAKCTFTWMLTLISNLVIALCSLTVLVTNKDSGVPQIGTTFLAVFLLTVMSAWIAPVSIVLTTAANSLAGVAIPFLVHLVFYVALWSWKFWWISPSSALGRVAQPLIGVLPSGEPIENGYTVSLWQTAVSILIALIFAAFLTLIGAHNYTRKETR